MPSGNVNRSGNSGRPVEPSGENRGSLFRLLSSISGTDILQAGNENKIGSQSFFCHEQRSRQLETVHTASRADRGSSSSIGLADSSFLFDLLRGQHLIVSSADLARFLLPDTRRDELLLKPLPRDITSTPFLTINGVDIKELGDPDLPGKEKIDMINVSYHYNTMKNQRLLDRWAESVRKIQANRYKYDIKMVAAPAEKDIWNEAVLFYKKEIQPITRAEIMHRARRAD